ncbi:MAG: hypothetical protein K2X87_22830 [Gemmataceae bacterium]|nr:hypothetical protein [Gemmataceae bacterium]
MGHRYFGLTLTAVLLIGVSVYGAFVPLPLPDIKGKGLGKYAVFDGKELDDTLLWKSEADPDGNRFRLWSLEDGAYYGVTFGKADATPGQLAAFCGYFTGRNNGRYDLAAGKLVFKNQEPAPLVDYAGQIVRTSEGDFKVVKGEVSITSKQGEFTDAKKLEFFNFEFDKAAAAGPAMTHDLFAGGPEKGHPANYVAKKVDLTQGLTVGNMYAAFESGGHVWNPKKAVIKALDYDNWEFEKVGGGDADDPDQGAVEDYIASTQPAAVPAPAGWVLLAVGGTTAVAAFRRRGRSPGRGAES